MSEEKNRSVVLVGDSAFARSFLSSQGTSIALIGAYLLATELVANADPARAFTAYEDKMRDFILRKSAAVRSSLSSSSRTRTAT